uniref:Uncharacterized protein n=1 Tax=Solanum lycopersicum TaxID=4081 RepID=A0A3Q7IEW0_SOLLC
MGDMLNFVGRRKGRGRRDKALLELGREGKILSEIPRGRGESPVIGVGVGVLRARRPQDRVQGWRPQGKAPGGA